MVSAVEKKQGMAGRACWTRVGFGRAAFKNRLFREGFPEKVIFEQRSEGGVREQTA